MEMVRSITAFYPLFDLGCAPQSVQCTISLLRDSSGRYWLRTPFAFLSATEKENLEAQYGRGYYRSAADCDEYLRAEYPHWQTAQDIMAALYEAHRQRRVYALANKLDVSTDQIYRLARGHFTFKLARVKKVAKLL